VVTGKQMKWGEDLNINENLMHNKARFDGDGKKRGNVERRQ